LDLINPVYFEQEQLYNVIATILFLVGIALLLWFMIQYNFWGVWMIIAMVKIANHHLNLKSNAIFCHFSQVCIVIIFLLFQWDFKGNRTMSDGHLPI
jgi:hypothetical protein